MMSENDDTDTICTTQDFTPNSTILSWRLRLGYAELYATLAPNMVNAVITAARETQPACETVDEPSSAAARSRSHCWARATSKGLYKHCAQNCRSTIPTSTVKPKRS